MPKMFSPSVPEASASLLIPVSGKSREAEPLKTGTREIQVVQFKDRESNRFVAGAVTGYGAGHGAVWPRRNSALMFSVDGLPPRQTAPPGVCSSAPAASTSRTADGTESTRAIHGLSLALARSNPAVSGATC